MEALDLSLTKSRRPISPRANGEALHFFLLTLHMDVTCRTSER